MSKHTPLPDFVALEVREWDGDEWPEKRVSLGCPYEKHAVAISPRYADIEQAKANMAEIAKHSNYHAKLVKALREVAATLDWQCHGCCRGLNDGPLMESNAAVELARQLLNQLDGETK